MGDVIKTIPKPNPKQVQFLQAHQKYVGYGGARGGGKSWAVRTKAMLLAAKYPGIKMLIVRRTYPELEGNHIAILRSLTVGIAHYNSTNKELRFVNGSTIKFMYCAKDADLDKLQGLEYDVIFIDEATHLSEYQMKAITACCRGVNNFPKRIYYTTNPGGQGHAYMKRIFVDRRFNARENPDDYIFIQALVDDNTALMTYQPEYVEQLEALPEKLRKAWREGRWDVFEGQVFGEFRDDETGYKKQRWSHVIDPFPIPESWQIYRGFDWGYAKPFSVGWYACSHKGVLYRIRELYGCTGEADVGVEWTAAEVGQKIYEIEHTDQQLIGRNIHGIADPAIFAADGGESIAESLEKCQVYFDKGDHQRLPGKMQCHYRLAFDEKGKSMFYVFKTCPNFIRTIPALIYSETDPEDVDTHMEDHIYDEWRYVCMSRPIAPRKKIIKSVPRPGSVEDPLNMVKDEWERENYFNIELF